MSSRSATALDSCGCTSSISELGEPTDQIDVVNGKIDHHADIRHARRERSDARDGDREDLFVADRFLDRFDGRVEPFDMANHQRHSGTARGGDDGASLLDRRRDRFLHQNVDAAGDAGERQLLMQVRWCGNRNGIDAVCEQALDRPKGRAAEQPRDEFALPTVGIRDADQLGPRQIGEHAGMVAAHHANAHHTYTQRTIRVRFGGLHHGWTAPPAVAGSPTPA